MAVREFGAGGVSVERVTEFAERAKAGLVRDERRVNVRTGTQHSLPYAQQDLGPPPLTTRPVLCDDPCGESPEFS